MRRPVITIASLMGAIALIGVALAALRSPTQLWAGITLSASLAAVTLAVLAAVYRRGRSRAFWVGFSVCGWVYLTLHLGPWFEHHIGPTLASTAALDFIYSQT